MSQGSSAPYRLAAVLACLMGAQSILGLVFADQYLDAPWLKAAWFGNDLVTLFLGVPLLATAVLHARRGSLRGRLVWMGMLGYAVYNYAYYMLGAELNAFFLLYVAALLVAVFSLPLVLVRIDVQRLAGQFHARLPARPIGGYFVFVAAGLALAWVSMWAAHVFTGTALPVEKEVFRLVASLDITLLAPVLATGGVLLWRRQPWGYAVATLAGVQATLYLLVLATNSVVAVARGLLEPPGELPVWGLLCLSMAVATAWLLASVQGRSGGVG